MRVMLTETVHKTFLPAGTVGELFIDSDGCRRFRPEQPCQEYGFNPQGAYLGDAKCKELGEE